MPDRVAIYIDAQNVYRGARETFFHPPTHFTDGQIDPLKVGQLICSRESPGNQRVLHEVRVYTGRPDSTKQPRAYAAHMRQTIAELSQRIRDVDGRLDELIEERTKTRWMTGTN